MNAPTGSCARPWLFAGLICVLLKFWLVAAQPVVAIGPAGHDDRLYLELANHILQGEWLGPYSQFTLMKGPMYSLWIVGIFLLGVPLPLAQHLLYLAGCVLVVRALRPHVRAGWPAFLVFALLWWNPMTYEMPVLGRILRQNLYTPATLLFFAALIALETRRGAALRIRIAWGLLLGFSGATLWLTREETIWAAPSAVLLIAAAAWASWRAGEKLRPLLAPLLTATVLSAALLLSVCTLNYRYYGTFRTVEFRAPEFIGAYGALQRIIPTQNIPYVPVTREARLQAYAVSPAFAELRPFLEGEMGRGWAEASSSHTGRPREALEIAGGWFMWALRDAVVAAGHGHSAREALAFYGRIAREVNRAADEGRLPARARHDTLAPSITSEALRHVAREAPPYFGYFLTFDGFSAKPSSSVGPAGALQLFRDLTRWSLAPSPEAPELDCPLQSRFGQERLITLNFIGRSVGRVATILAFAGLLAWLWLAGRSVRQRSVRPLFVIATAVFGAWVAVVAINLFVHVLSFSNRSPGAFAQAYPLLLLFSALVLIELAHDISRGISALGLRPNLLR